MGLLEILGIKKKNGSKGSESRAKNSSGVISPEEKQTPMGEKISIGVPIPIVVGYHFNAKSYNRGNNLEDRDLDTGRYVQIKGYKGTYKILFNQDAWDGLFHLELERADLPEGYKERVAVIENYCDQE